MWIRDRAQGVEGVHRDLPRRKAVHKVDVNHGQFSGIMYAVHQPVYGEQGARHFFANAHK